MMKNSRGLRCSEARVSLVGESHESYQNHCTDRPDRPDYCPQHFFRLGAEESRFRPTLLSWGCSRRILWRRGDRSLPESSLSSAALILPRLLWLLLSAELWLLPLHLSAPLYL